MEQVLHHVAHALPAPKAIQPFDIALPDRPPLAFIEGTSAAQEAAWYVLQYCAALGYWRDFQHFELACSSRRDIDLESLVAPMSYLAEALGRYRVMPLFKNMCFLHLPQAHVQKKIHPLSYNRQLQIFRELDART